MLGAKKAGYFTNYTSLIMISAMFTSHMFGLLTPMLIEQIGKKNTKKIETLQSFMFNDLVLLSLSMSGFFLVFGPELAEVLY